MECSTPKELLSDPNSRFSKLAETQGLSKDFNMVEPDDINEVTA